MLDSIKPLRVYSPGMQARDWGFAVDQVVDYYTALMQPDTIAVLPVYYDDPEEFSWLPEYQHIDPGLFDLVLFTDIEFRPQTQLVEWIKSKGISRWLLTIGGLTHNEYLHPQVVYRPGWALNFMQWNQQRNDFPLQRPFLFDCLCGTRRTQREYVMLSLLESGLLDQCIVTYRDIFQGGDCVQTPPHVQTEFPDFKVPWPYVSPNLNPEWEVSDHVDHSISGLVPWEIYNRTYFSILTETLGYGNTFLAAEKVGKCLYARRLFVHFGACYFLHYLRSLGFETFDSVLDESYDLQQTDIERWRCAFEQVKWLSKQNPQQLLAKVKPILDHNHDRLHRLNASKTQEQHRAIDRYLQELARLPLIKQTT